MHSDEQIINDAPKHYDRYKTHALARNWPIPPYEEWLPVYLKVWGVDIPRETTLTK